MFENLPQIFNGLKILSAIFHTVKKEYNSYFEYRQNRPIYFSKIFFTSCSNRNNSRSSCKRRLPSGKLLIHIKILKVITEKLKL